MADFNLHNQLLIATPSMQDPYFQKSVAYVCEHNERGAMGIIINHPMNITVADLLHHMELLPQEMDPEEVPLHLQQTVLAGGPLQRERGFVLHRPAGDWQSSFVIENDLTITTSRDILQAMVDNQGPEQVLIALGYTGWEAGQLEEEITQNSWINCSVDYRILFDTPSEQRWQAAGRSLGIDLLSLPNSFGHA